MFVTIRLINKRIAHVNNIRNFLLKFLQTSTPAPTLGSGGSEKQFNKVNHQHYNNFWNTAIPSINYPDLQTVWEEVCHQVFFFSLHLMSSLMREILSFTCLFQKENVDFHFLVSSPPLSQIRWKYPIGRRSAEITRATVVIFTYYIYYIYIIWIISSGCPQKRGIWRI